MALASCRKEVEKGTEINASGFVLDSVKNKRLPSVKVYLYGAKQTFYGVHYTIGPLDSAISDPSGNFSIHYRAEGRSIDYALTLNPSWAGDEVAYASDFTQAEHRFNYATQVTGVVLKARELHPARIWLQVASNPYDTFYVSILKYGGIGYTHHLIRGKSIDTVLYAQALPNGLNFVSYMAARIGADSGSIDRRLMDSLITNLDDTVQLTKRINSIYDMPLAH